MIDFYEALNNVLTNTKTSLEIIDIPLEEANDYILAQDIVANFNMPIFDNSAMDGYAINDISLKKWHIIDRIIAGDNKPNIVLEQGQSVRIFTGAPVPKNSQAVIMQEYITAKDDYITLKEDVVLKINDNIRLEGEENTKGEILVKKNTKINPAIIAIAATQGYTYLTCFKKLKIIIFSNGNELQKIGEPLKFGKIFDSNSIMLLSWIKSLGFDCDIGGILPDSEEIIRNKIIHIINKYDVVISTGGVSVGEEDYMKNVLTKLGNIIQYKLNIKPGKPFCWGFVERTQFFLLPGNAVSSMVTFNLLVVPALKKLAGIHLIRSSYFLARAKFTSDKINSRRLFLRGELKFENKEFWAIVDNCKQGSAMLTPCASANILIEIEPKDKIEYGKLIKVYPLEYKFM